MSGGVDITKFPNKWKIDQRIGKYETNKQTWAEHAVINLVPTLKAGQNIIIDGTKMESVANKYTFVWKKTVEKNKAKLEEKIKNILSQIDEGIAQDNTPDADTIPDAIDSRLLARKIEELNEQNRQLPRETKEEKQSAKAKAKTSTDLLTTHTSAVDARKAETFTGQSSSDLHQASQTKSDVLRPSDFTIFFSVVGAILVLLVVIIIRYRSSGLK